MEETSGCWGHGINIPKLLTNGLLDTFWPSRMEAAITNKGPRIFETQWILA